LVLFDEEQPMTTTVANRLTKIPVGEHRIGGHHAARQDQLFQHGQGRFVLIGLVGTAGQRPLGQRQARLLSHQAQQMDGRLQRIATATQRLAVQGCCLQRLGGAGGRGNRSAGVRQKRPAQHVFRPSGQGALKSPYIQSQQDLADAVPFRRPAGKAQSMHECQIVILGKLGDGRNAPAATENGAAGQSEDRGQRMLPAMPTAWVWNLGEKGKQAPLGKRRGHGMAPP
jgi:hypothetical protein